MNNQTTKLPARLQFLVEQNQQHILTKGLKGIEKESLRITQPGQISQKDHPYTLGSALTHPHITTDYSEALLEFITAPSEDIQETLENLQHIHQFVYESLDHEMLLTTSMPCGINGDESIRIAEYGLSNIGQMKHVYRKGLWFRYGRTMQSIAGIHFNYSAPEALWPALHQFSQTNLSLEDYISESYFGMIRNFQRHSWLILYLFGASPAICKQFFKSRPHLMAPFEEFDPYTLYYPYATSLRMSNIGYKSENQSSLNIDYNSLTGYVDSLSKAIETPYPEYQAIGVKKDGEYLQLNSNILQIENEYYSTIRPKQIAYSGEKPTLALKRRGVRYIEIRSLDLNVFTPIGIDSETGYFLEAFLLYCLFNDSPLKQPGEQKINNENQLAVANSGRQPGLMLNKNGEQIAFQRWATEILNAMRPICEILDQQMQQTPYMDALNQQATVLKNPDLTPSGRILNRMRSRQLSFGRFGISSSQEHQLYFNDHHLDQHKREYFQELAVKSHQKQKQIETTDELPFQQFLYNYFSQK